MEYTLLPHNWKEYIFHRGLSWNSQSILGRGIIPVGKENDKARQAVFFIPLDPFGKDPDEEKPDDDYTVHQKVHHESFWTRNQDAENWIKLSRAQDQGLQFWQTKSFAIITYATVPGDCSDRVISQNGDRVIFERLATPRPAPKVTLKSNWHTQQHQQQQTQQPTLEKGVNSIWKQRASWESKAGVRDDTKNATEMNIASTKLVREISEVDVGTHLSKQEVITDALSNEIKRILKKSNK